MSANKRNWEKEFSEEVAERLRDFPQLEKRYKAGKISAWSAHIRMEEMKGRTPIHRLRPCADDSKQIVRQLRAVKMRAPLWSAGMRLGKIDTIGHAPRMIGLVNEAIEALEEFKNDLQEVRHEQAVQSTGSKFNADRETPKGIDALRNL